MAQDLAGQAQAARQHRLQQDSLQQQVRAGASPWPGQLLLVLRQGRSCPLQQLLPGRMCC
jgi:hypothetical protein